MFVSALDVPGWNTSLTVWFAVAFGFYPTLAGRAGWREAPLGPKLTWHGPAQEDGKIVHAFTAPARPRPRQEPAPSPSPHDEAGIFGFSAPVRYSYRIDVVEPWEGSLHWPPSARIRVASDGSLTVKGLDLPAVVAFGAAVHEAGGRIRVTRTRQPPAWMLAVASPLGVLGALALRDPERLAFPSEALSV